MWAGLRQKSPIQVPICGRNQVFVEISVQMSSVVDRIGYEEDSKLLPDSKDDTWSVLSAPITAN